jgi:hypothetical protein
MATGRFADRITQAWLYGPQLPPVIEMEHWGALMTNDPFTTSDPLSVELPGPGYRRPQLFFEGVSQVLRNTNVAQWLAIAPQSRIVGVAGFDEPFNGDIIWYCPLDEPLDFATGGSWQIDIHDLYLGIDS